MRLWLLHPKYLDTKGFVALWREALLAQRVLVRLLNNEDKVGYKNHPALLPFKSLPDNEWLDSIGNYLTYIYDESVTRNFNFNKSLIISNKEYKKNINILSSQVASEIVTLALKLKVRDQNKLQELYKGQFFKLNPIFKLTDVEMIIISNRDYR